MMGAHQIIGLNSLLCLSEVQSCCFCYLLLIPQFEYCWNKVSSSQEKCVTSGFPSRCMKSQAKLWSCCRTQSFTTSSVQHAVIRTAEDKIIYMIGLLTSQSSLNWKKGDEIMTQRSLNVLLSYFCNDKNDLIKCCLCFNLFIYSLSCTFGCGTKLCWLWKHQTMPKFLPDSALRPREDGKHGSLIWRRLDTSSLQERLLVANQTLITPPFFLLELPKDKQSKVLPAPLSTIPLSWFSETLFTLCDKFKKWKKC